MMGLADFRMLVLAFLWALLNVGDAVWMYFYIQACVDPNLDAPINRTRAGFKSFEVFMYIFGFFVGIVNLLAAYCYYISLHHPWAHCDPQKRPRGYRVAVTLYYAFQLLVAAPIAIILVLLPFFGGLIITPIAQHISSVPGSVSPTPS